MFRIVLVLGITAHISVFIVRTRFTVLLSGLVAGSLVTHTRAAVAHHFPIDQVVFEGDMRAVCYDAIVVVCDLGPVAFLAVFYVNPAVANPLFSAIVGAGIVKFRRALFQVVAHEEARRQDGGIRLQIVLPPFLLIETRRGQGAIGDVFAIGQRNRTVWNVYQLAVAAEKAVFGGTVFPVPFEAIREDKNGTAFEGSCVDGLSFE